MVEQSYNFDFTRINDFFENLNIKFKIADMNKLDDNGDVIGTAQSKFELVLASYCSEDIDDCLDNTGKIDTSMVSIAKDINNNNLIETIGLDWVKGDYGEATIQLHDDCTFDIGDINVPLKGIFLRTNDSNKFVIGYCLNNVAFSITNQLDFDEGIIFWDISRFKSNDE